MGKIEVLIFLTTTNLIMVPATKMAIRLLTNHASMSISTSKAMMRNATTAATVYIIIGLSEQYAMISAKYIHKNSKEKNMVP